MDGTIFCLTKRNRTKPGIVSIIPSMLVGFSDLPENVTLTPGLALEYFKSARKQYKVIVGKEFELFLDGHVYLIDKIREDYVIYELKEMLRDADDTDGAE